MKFYYVNDFKCLSHALTRAILRSGIPAISSIPEEVRELLAHDDVKAVDVSSVVLHQCPGADDVINYLLHVSTEDGGWRESEFMVKSPCSVHQDFLLYDKERDGQVEYLHLLH